MNPSRGQTELQWSIVSATGMCTGENKLIVRITSEGVKEDEAHVQESPTLAPH
jgi:hypothetical protein